MTTGTEVINLLMRAYRHESRDWTLPKGLDPHHRAMFVKWYWESVQHGLIELERKQRRFRIFKRS